MDAPDQGLGLIQIQKIGLKYFGPDTRFAGLFRSCLGIPGRAVVMDRDILPAPGQIQRDGPAQTPRAARDQCSHNIAPTYSP